MKQHRTGDGEHTLAVFIDFENLALGFHGRRDKFEIDRVLERLVEKGKIVVKKAYSDWSRFGAYTGPLHEAAIELIEIPKRTQTGKNSADIRLVVDAIDLAYSKDHIDTFCIVSGDSDFSPLVSKLKELGKHVIGLGLTNATSELLRDNCDEFIYYEDLTRTPVNVPNVMTDQLPEGKLKLFKLLLESLTALRRENKEVMYSSMVKDTMKRKKPSFNEGYYGYNTFSELLEDAEKNGILELEKHKSSGTYVVTRFSSEPRRVGGTPPAPVAPSRVEPAPAARIVRSTLERPMVSAPTRELPQRELPQRELPPREAVVPREVKPAIVPPVRRPVVEAPAPVPVPTNDRSFGRALIDEADDGLDEVPSYRPRKVVAPPAAAAKPPIAATPTPAPTRVRKPTAAVVEGAPAVKPVAKPTTTRSATPRTTAAKPPAKPAVAGEATKPVTRATPAARKPATAKIAPPPVRDPDEFGAGLDDAPPAPTAPAKPATRTPPPPPKRADTVPDDDAFGAGLD